MKKPCVLKMTPALRDLVKRALREDVGRGDVTTLALVPAGSVAEAVILARSDSRVSGTSIAKEVFRQVDRRIRCRIMVGDGRAVRKSQVIMRISGPTRGVLTGERVALNFMQRMTGVATLTGRFVAAAGPGVKILDTRKTTPTLRALEKYAVRCGGGTNHRMGLYDMVLIKDNHRALWGRGLDLAVTEARRRFPGVPVEIEVESEDDLRQALRSSPDWVLLDNMDPARLRTCVKICAGRAQLEASGGITLETVRSVARTGVDAISVGALTHSAPAADLSLEIVRVRG